MGFIKSNIALTARYREIRDKLSDDSLTDEERKYYIQLAYRIGDEIDENLKEAVEELNKDPIKFFEENYMEKDPRTLYDFNKTLEFKNKLEKLKKSFSRDVF